MASEDLFQEDFSEEIIGELDQDYVGDIEKETALQDDFDDIPETVIQTENTSEEVEINRNTKSNPTEHKSKLFQLPLTRIRNLMKLDPDLHIASNEAVFAVTRATELFVESLARESFTYTTQAKKKTVQKRDVDLAISAVDSLMFLEGAMNF